MSLKNLKFKHKILALGDQHSPYIDKENWALILKAIRKLKPTDIVILGDFMDCYPISRFVKLKKRFPNFTEELVAANKLLDQLQSAAGKAKIYYLEGNHEARWPTFIDSKGLKDIGLRDIPTILRLKQRGIAWFPYKGEPLKLGDVFFEHDIERSGKYADRQALADYGAKLVMGHSHQAGMSYISSVQGDLIWCMTCGWGGDFDEVDYRNISKAKREWLHGVGQIVVDYSGAGWAHFAPVISNKLHVMGWGDILR